MPWPRRRRSPLVNSRTVSCRCLLLLLALFLAPSSAPAGPTALGPPSKSRKHAAPPTQADPAEAAPVPSAPPASPTGPASGSPTVPAPAADTDLATRVNALVDQLKVREARNTARAGILALGKDATPTLLTRFRDPDFTVRWEMANIQGDLKDDRTVEALVDNVLRDENPHIRWRSIWALNEFPPLTDTRTMALLREAMAGEDWPTRWNAAIGLSMFRARECLPVIEKGITDEAAWRRWEAINALGRIHDAKSAGLLGPVLLKSQDKRERFEAALALGRVGTPEAVDLLISVLGDAEQGLRWRACMALGFTGSPRAVADLARVKANDTDPEVIRHATSALNAIASRR